MNKYKKIFQSNYNKLPTSEKEILKVVGESANEINLSAYVIGGYVRDILLDRERKDIDVVCVGSGIKLAQQVSKNLGNTSKVSVFKRFGTAQIVYNDFEIEFVGARKESYSADSRKPTIENGSLEDDQLRRDFTVNTLSIGLNGRDEGKLIDPFDGLSDLESKILKTPREPGQTFSDDPLRILRAIRFANQLNFQIDELTYRGILDNSSRISILSQERISAEINKILLCDQPSIGFKLLLETGVLQLILNEVSDLLGVDTIKGIGHKDNFYHTLEVVDNLAKNSNDLWLRWAALLHDIAKPRTKKFVEGIGWTFHGHDAIGAYMVPKIFKRLKLPLNHSMKYVQKLVRMHLRPISLTKANISDSALRRLIFDAGDDLEDLMILCEADITSKNPKKVKRYLENYVLVRESLANLEEADRIRNWQPPISGELIMKTFSIKPSKNVGVIKDKIREAILDGDIENSYEQAFEFMLVEGKRLGLLID